MLQMMKGRFENEMVCFIDRRFAAVIPFIRVYSKYKNHYFYFRSSKDKESTTSNNRQTNPGVYHMENTQVTFNPKNFKILYVINSENCFYRKLALTRAKNVSMNDSKNKFPL